MNSSKDCILYRDHDKVRVAIFRLEISEDQMKAAFEQRGSHVTAFKFFQSTKEKKMALVQLQSVEEAMHALIVSLLLLLHAYAITH